MNLPSARFLARTPFLLGLFLTILLGSPLSAGDFGIGTQPAENPILPRVWAPGSSVTLVLNGTPASGNYQWFHNHVPIPGATATSLTLNNLTAADGGNYALVLTNGSVVKSSDPLTINVLPPPPSPVDLTFTAQLPAPTDYPTIAAIAPNGQLIVTNSVNGTRLYVVRLNADGSLDPTLTYPASAGTVLAVAADGSLIHTAPPYRLDATGASRPLVLPAGFDSAQQLGAAVFQADGKLLVAQGSHLARLNPDDSVDSSFTYLPSLGSTHIVTALKLDATGRVYVTATTFDPVPGHFPSSWPVLFRITAAGAQDAFLPQTPPLLRGSVFITPLNDGRRLLYRSYEGIAYWSMLNDDGTTDPNWADSSGGMPTLIDVDPLNLRVVTAEFGNRIRRLLITPTGLVNDDTFYQGNGPASSLRFTPTGKVLITGSFTQRDGHVSPGIARLNFDQVVTSYPLVVNAGLSNSNPARGETVTLVANIVRGTGPFTYQWTAQDGQPLPADTTSAQLVIPSFDRVNYGGYQVKVTGPNDSALSGVATISFSQSVVNRPYLANLSGRAYVGTGDDTAIAGFAARINVGALGVSTLLRGAGPALKDYGVGNFLPNPLLNLFNASSTLIANNDTWGGGTDLRNAASTVGAFPFSPDSNDAALLHTFGTGSFSVQLADQGNASGIGLVEIYQVPLQYSLAELVNLSLRARTGPGDKVAIAGFVITDPLRFDSPLRVLLRVVGPTLSKYGVSAPLPDPVLTLYNSRGEVVATNDNWSSSPNAADIATASTQVGAFALASGSKDAAVLLDLPAGIYSIQAQSAPGSADTGVTLVEIYVAR